MLFYGDGDGVDRGYLGEGGCGLDVCRTLPPVWLGSRLEASQRGSRVGNLPLG